MEINEQGHNESNIPVSTNERTNEEYECVTNLENYINKELARIHNKYGYCLARIDTTSVKHKLPQTISIRAFRLVTERYPGEFRQPNIPTL